MNVCLISLLKHLNQEKQSGSSKFFCISHAFISGLIGVVMPRVFKPLSYVHISVCICAYVHKHIKAFFDITTACVFVCARARLAVWYSSISITLLLE